MTDPERSARTSRLLLIAGAAVGVLAVISWFAVGSNDKNTSSDGSCRVPAHGTAGTEAPPALVAQVAAPIGTPDVTATVTSSGSTVYVYCYDLIDGSQLIAAINTLRQSGYAENPGQDRSSQLVFTSDTKVPYGVNLTVDGQLATDHPDARTHGGLSITWVDAKPR